MELIRSKRGGRGKRLSDAEKLNNYVAYNRNSYRKEKGQYINGAYVENEMICAVAHQNSLIINVAHATQPEVQVVTPDGSFISYRDERAEGSPFFLWCTGGHYQAILKLQDVEVLSSALLASGFILGHVLKSDDIRTPQ
jgi:hypothetical protein